MKNRKWKLFTYVCTSLVLVGTLPTLLRAVASEAETSNDEPIRLWHAIANAPPEVEAMATTLGFKRFAYVPPKLYTRGKPKRFDQQRFNQNLAAIKAICDGAEWIATDLEHEPRAIIRNPDRYTRVEADWAKQQYRSMWRAFRKTFPDAKLIEYNFPSGRRDGHFALMDELTIKHLDGLAPSVYWHDNPNWPERAADRISHALKLGREHDMPVIAWITDRYKDDSDGTIVINRVPPHDGLMASLGFATTDTYGVVLWSSTCSLMNLGNPHRVIPEMLEPNYEAADVYAELAVVMGEVRRMSR